MRLVFGNMAVMIAVFIFACLEMLPFWLLLIPIGIHLFIFFDALKQQRRKNTQKSYDT